MSWTYGTIGKETPLSRKHKDATLSIESADLCIHAGGPTQTCMHAPKCTSGHGWLVLGLGILANRHDRQIMTCGDWSLRLHDGDFPPDNPDGHFCIVQWNQDQIRFITDCAGLREVHVKPTKNGFLFSTRINDLAPLEFDFNALGSRWLLYNQLSTESIFKNVTRVTAGLEYIINRKTMETRTIRHAWTPTAVRCDANHFESVLNSLILAALSDPMPLSLSLSGGMDSRVILSVLKKMKMRWDVHTFGDPRHPDVQVSRRMATDLNIPFRHLNRPFPDAEQMLSAMQAYVAHTQLCGPASSFLQLNNYNHFMNRNDLLIDGGFGELWRREFFFKLLSLGKGSLLQKDANALLPHLGYERAPIFNPDIVRQMKAGCRSRLIELLDMLPEPKAVGAENWLDWFAVKTRLPNFYGQEQARLDGIAPGFMPFAQTSLVNLLFGLPVGLRKNGRLFKHIIRKNAPDMMKYPLVKGNASHPWFMNSLQSRLWHRLTERLGIHYQDHRMETCLDVLADYIDDTMHSKAVLACGLYDHDALKSIRKHPFQLDWWLSFELLRQQIAQ